MLVALSGLMANRAPKKKKEEVIEHIGWNILAPKGSGVAVVIVY